MKPSPLSLRHLTEEENRDGTMQIRICEAAMQIKAAQNKGTTVIKSAPPTSLCISQKSLLLQQDPSDLKLRPKPPPGQASCGHWSHVLYNHREGVVSEYAFDKQNIVHVALSITMMAPSLSTFVAPQFILPWRALEDRYVYSLDEQVYCNKKEQVLGNPQQYNHKSILQQAGICRIISASLSS
ncbi:hypothetical protein ACA910_009655 [Epithemia clementina (nom. ined.)]